MIPWTCAALLLYHTVDLGVAVSSTALAVVNRAAIFCTDKAVAEFAERLDDCLAESARGR